MPKSAQAFRTIREVAEWLDVAAHVLRFWESKFTQIKPVKRAGGRRYYRPADMELVGGIKVLLHERGLTIRGVQKMITDEGVEAVTALSPPIDELIGDGEVVELEASDAWDDDAAAETEEVAEASEAEEDAPDLPEPPPQAPELAIVPPPEPAVAPTAEPEAAAPPFADAVSEAAEPVAEAPPLDAPLPAADPAEGPLGTLAALSRLPAERRTALRPQIAALAQLRDSLLAPAENG